MRVFHGLDEFKITKSSVVAVGTFDGMHLGHMKVVDEVTRISCGEDLSSVIVTFKGHPMRKIQPKRVPCSLTTNSEKMYLIEQREVDALVIIDFDEIIAALRPEEFVDLLVKRLACRWIVMGYDNAFGRGREGTPEYIGAMSLRKGYGFTLVDQVQLGDVVVSSTEIRRRLGLGDVRTAAELLGHRYFISGAVIHGDKRGRTLGFPTANVTTERCKCLPLNGVYATRALINGRSCPSITNVGTRPTFYDTNSAEVSIEVHLFEEHASVYGEEVKLEFVDFIRPEQRFSDTGSLISQINLDILRAKDILSSVCF